jgi:hypothetical protein
MDRGVRQEEVEMSLAVRVRLVVETVLGALAGLLAVVTLVTRDWIELVFRVDPDAGSGTVEWALVVGLVAVAATCGLVARTEFRRVLAT